MINYVMLLVASIFSFIQPFSEDPLVYDTVDYVTYQFEPHVKEDELDTISYEIIEKIYYKNGVDVDHVYKIPSGEETSYPYDTIKNIAHVRGFRIDDNPDTSIIEAYPDPEYLNYLKDKEDGWISDVDSFDYATEDEMRSNTYKHITAWIGFGLFLTFAPKFKNCFEFFYKEKKGV